MSSYSPCWKGLRVHAVAAEQIGERPDRTGGREPVEDLVVLFGQQGGHRGPRGRDIRQHRLAVGPSRVDVRAQTLLVPAIT